MQLMTVTTGSPHALVLWFTGNICQVIPYRPAEFAVPEQFAASVGLDLYHI